MGILHRGSHHGNRNEELIIDSDPASIKIHTEDRVTEARPGGRPRVQINHERLQSLRAEGWSLRKIAQECGANKDTVRTILTTLSKNCLTIPRLQSLDEGVVPHRGDQPPPPTSPSSGTPLSPSAEREAQRQNLLISFEKALARWLRMAPLARFLDYLVPRGYSRADVEWAWREAILRQTGMRDGSA